MSNMVVFLSEIEIYITLYFTTVFRKIQEVCEKFGEFCRAYWLSLEIWPHSFPNIPSGSAEKHLFSPEKGS